MVLWLGVRSQPGEAQSAARPEVVVGLSVGSLTGGHLWSLPRQLVPVPPDGMDSLALGRRLLRPTLTMGVSATLYRSALVGYTVEALYLGFGTESRCTPLGPFVPDSRNLNEAACNGIEGRRTNHLAVALQGGVTLRSNAGSGSHFSVRALAGAAYLARSLTLLQARVGLPPPGTSTTVALLEERSPVSFTWIASVSAGARLKLSRDYNAAVQIGDIAIGLPVPTGPADWASSAFLARPTAPVARRAFHFPTLSVALDLVLGRERQRRY